MPGYGPNDPDLVVIAESPSKVEDTWCRVCNRAQTKTCVANKHARGAPLVGPSGQLLRRALKDAGFDPERVFYTNVVRCGGGNPTMIHVRKCRGYILDELPTLNYGHCKAVFTLGEIATRAILNDGRITLRETRHRVLDQWGPSLPVPLRCTYHPAAALPHRSPELYDEIVDDLRGAWKQRDRYAGVQKVTTAEALGELIGKSQTVAIDLEWRRDNTIRMVGLSDGRRNIITSAKTALSWLKKRR